MFKLKPLASSVALSLLTGIAVAAAPGGAILQNKVTATYTDIGGKAYTADSNIVEISIREVRNSTLTITQGENQQVAMISGSKVYSVHTLANNGNVGETYALTAANVTGGGDTLDASALKIYLDANGNGVLDSGETTPITSQAVAAGTSVKLILETTLPETIAASDTLNVTLDAKDSKNTAATSTNTVNITFKNSNVTTAVHIWQQTAGGNCHAYTLVDTSGQSWTQAKATAATLVHNGVVGHLVTVTSAEENAFLTSIIGNNIYSGKWAWLGAEKPNGSWSWVTGETFGYTKWANTSSPPSAPVYMHASGLSAPVGTWWSNVGIATPLSFVEFDVDCPLPNVTVALEGAKDVTCDGIPDDAFGTARLAEMGSGECAIMRSRATNNGQSIAKNVLMSYTVPQYATYKTGTLQYNGAANTDAADTDAGKYDTATKKVQFSVGDLDVNAVSPDAQFSVKID